MLERALGTLSCVLESRKRRRKASPCVLDNRKMGRKAAEWKVLGVKD
jgi:hypothetical protein